MDVSDLDRLSSQVRVQDNHDDKWIEIKNLLDQESYEILVLHYVNGLKFKEIAVLKKVSTSVITNKASRAMKLLKGKLKK